MGTEIAISMSQIMKLTGRLLMAFALAQFIAVLCGLTVDGSESLCVQVGGRSILDFGAVVLISAGWAVSKGSREGRFIAALLSLFFTLSAMHVLIMTAFFGSPQMSFWHLLVIFVVGIWSGTNLLLLICLCDLKSCLPRYSLRALMILVLLVSIGFKGLQWLHEIGQPPPFASVSAIEQNYEPQLQHLLELAQDKQLLIGRAFNDPTDVVLFNAPEILEAVVQSPGSGQHLGSKTYKFESRFRVLRRQPSIGSAVVNLHWDTQPGGNKLTVLEYHRRTRDAQGSEVGVILLLDFSALEQKAAKRTPNNSLQTDAAKMGDAKNDDLRRL